MKIIRTWMFICSMLALASAYAQPAENTPGNNRWNVYTYTSSGTSITFDRYVGFFSFSSQSLDVAAQALGGFNLNPPSVASGYTRTSTTAVGLDYWSLKMYRTGWTCGEYEFRLTSWDDHLRIYVDTDGNGTWDHVTSQISFGAAVPSPYRFSLNPSSIVMVTFKEIGGAAYMTMNINYVSAAPSFCYSAAVSSTSNVSCPGASDGQVGITVTSGTPPFTINGVSYNTRNITVSGLSANAYSWSIADALGNTRAVSFSIGTTPDPTPPTVLTRNVTAYLNATGTASITTSNVNNGTSDNCTVSSLTLDKTAFDCTDLGANTVTLTATDQSGNTASRTATVTVVDTVSPTVVTQNKTIYLDFNGQASITTADINNGTSDNCTVSSLALNQTAFNCSHLGANTVTLTATDQSGNTASRTAAVTVVDTVSPTVVTQNITLTLDANGQASTTAAAVDNGTSDNCTIASLALSQTAFTCADLGNNAVTLTATDQSGNTATGTAIVRVIDTQNPTLVIQPVDAYLDASGQVSVTANDFDNGTFDNCTITSLTVNRTAFTCADLGSNTLTVSALDQSGNSATANVTLTVIDTVSPIPMANNDTILYLDANGMATLSAVALDAGTSDNCSVASIALSQTVFDCSDLGSNTVIFTATDGSGNAATKALNVFVLDTIMPVAVAQPDTLYLNANGEDTLLLARIDAGSSDNCGLLFSGLSRTAYSCGDVGADTVVLIVVDPAGNLGRDTVQIIVRDTIRPTPLVQNISVYLDTMGMASFDTTDVNAGSFDNCSIDTMYLSKYGVGCAELGTDSVMYHLVDVNGNSDSAKAYVSVWDTIAPILKMQGVTVYLDSMGLAPLTVAQVDTGTWDNCSLDTLFLSRTTLTCADVGQVRIAFTAIDQSGNISQDTVNVTVIDTIAPVIETRTITKYLDPSGMTTLTVAEIEVSSTDNCGIASKSLSHNVLECSEVGFFPVVLYVTDVNGNVATDTAIIAVEDVNDPIIVTQNATIELDSNGRAILNPNVLNNGSYDNCAVASFLASQTSFNCDDLGNNPVLATAIDEAGNTSSTSVFVNVVDRIAPVVLTRDVTVVLDTLGQATIEASAVDAGSFDNCGVASIALDRSTFDCSYVGQPTTVTLIVTDGSGNTALGTANVTVVDDVAPEFKCHPYEWSMDAGGFLSLTAEDMIDSIVELCDYSVTLSQTAFDVSHIGENPVQIVMTDAGGNVTTCETVVRVRFDCIPYNGIITPNNDGYNDSWEVECLAAVDNEVAVYNRFGQVVFIAENYTGGWTGTATDGSPLPRGTYFYLIKTYIAGKERSIRGNITILRK